MPNARPTDWSPVDNPGRLGPAILAPNHLVFRWLIEREAYVGHADGQIFMLIGRPSLLPRGLHVIGKRLEPPASEGGEQSALVGIVTKGCCGRHPNGFGTGSQADGLKPKLSRQRLNGIQQSRR